MQVNSPLKAKSVFNDDAVKITPKEYKNPESLFYDFLLNNQLKHIESLTGIMDEVDDKVDIIEKEVK